MKFIGYIDVDDGCLRRYVLVTIFVTTLMLVTPKKSP